MQCLQNMQLEIPDERAQKNVETEEILSGHNTFCDSVPAPLKHSFSISCFMHSFWDFFFSPQIKIKYFL